MSHAFVECFETKLFQCCLCHLHKNSNCIQSSHCGRWWLLWQVGESLRPISNDFGIKLEQLLHSGDPTKNGVCYYIPVNIPKSFISRSFLFSCVSVQIVKSNPNPPERMFISVRLKHKLNRTTKVLQFLIDSSFYAEVVIINGFFGATIGDKKCRYWISNRFRVDNMT